MATITNVKEFKAALESLSDEQQRVLGAKFIAEVLDLAENKQLKDIQALAANADASIDDLLSAYRQAQSIAVDLSYHGILEPIDFKKQAEHYVAKGCVACLFPLPASAKFRHRAWNVAHYCREARMCSNLKHEQDTDILANVEKELHAAINKQYRLTSEFLDKT
jgi:hypothetical protein